MKHSLKSWIGKYLNEQLDFRAQIFNTLGLLGCASGLIFGVLSIVNLVGIGSVIANFGAAAALLIIWYANRTGAFRPFFLITVILVFFLIFPFLFFTGGGYRGGMPCFFVFAIVFTVIMLEGRRRMIFTVLEFVLYAICFLTAVLYPETIRGFPTEESAATDIILGCFASSVVLAIAIIQHTVIYDKKHRQLADANRRLSELDRIKTEFLQDIKHEIRSPLTAISLGADFLLDMVDDEQETRDAILTVQSEAMRLGRMINGMVELANMSEKPQNRERIDFAAMLKKQSEAARFELEAKGNTLRVEIAPDLPYIYAEAEQIERVPANLLDNAARFTENGEITLLASYEGNDITVRVRDTGAGISPELLPRVFERGVSGRDGNGYGLFYCKTIVEAHGGTIEINSQCTMHNSQCKGGTSVTFTIPVYGGQDIGAIHNS